MFAALTSTITTVPVPSPPERGDPHHQSLGYWGALHYLLLYRFGWSNPGQGLHNWTDDGLPLDGPALHLVRDIWWADGTLDSYIAWTIASPKTYLHSSLQVPHPWGEPAPAAVAPHWRELVDRVMSRRSPERPSWGIRGA